MEFATMSQTRVRAWLAILVWTVAGIGFGTTFFVGGGPDGLAEDSMRHAAGAGALAFGFLGHWLAQWLTRRRRGEPPRADERDFHVLARANQAALIVVLVGVFACAITLWTLYEGRGQVPVGWMWFLAYGSVILASLASGVSTLVLDGRMGGHG